MPLALWLAALTVATSPDVGCPDEQAIALRLTEAGITIRPEDDVRVRFFRADADKRVAEIAMPGAAARRIDHDGPDCTSLADATIALLTVLLDERAHAAPPPPSPAPAEIPLPRFRVEAGPIVSSGIVAPFAVGAAIGVAFKPARWASVGLDVELWPEREHAAGAGTVTVNATTFALAACAGPAWGIFALEGCALGHAGTYGLSALGFSVTYPTRRALFGVEAAIRPSFALSRSTRIFARAGAWIPFTRLDIAVHGTASGYSTTALGPKAIVGLELDF